jgi:hypothetical protein
MSIFAKKISEYEYGYSQGYEVNIQLRPGERITRNWSNKGLHVNMGGGGAPGCLTSRAEMKYQEKLGDHAPGRVGNGTIEYDVPLADPALPRTALVYENVAGGEGGAMRVVNPDKPGVLVLRMPSSYVYLSGQAALKAAVGAGGAVTVGFSDNNGLDWREVKKITETGEQTIDLKPLVFRRYDYRLKIEMTGAGTRLDALKLTHDIQHSQAPLPILGPGKNTITFNAGPQEGTITIEGSTNPSARGKQLLAADFHPDLQGIDERLRVGGGGRGDATFKVTTPGDITRIRFGAHYRARDARDGFDLQVSFDGAQNFKTVGRLEGPFRGNCKYVTVAEVSPGTKEALVRYSGRQSNTACIFDFRIDADYKEPAGGFRPVKVTYVWDEGGAEKRDVHVAQSPNETYTITCAGAPVMKSIVFELAQ